MKFFDNIKMKFKLIAMISAPVLALLYLSISGVIEKSQLHSQIGQVRILSDFAVKASALLHELQKERGMTAGYLGSKGKSFANELLDQRKQADVRKQDFASALQNIDLDLFSREFKAGIDKTVQLLDQIDGKRNAITGQSISTKEAVGYYTQANASILDLIGTIGRNTSTVEQANMASAYLAFLQGKERAGIERAVLSNTFAADQFRAGFYARFIELVSAQKLFFGMFQESAIPSQLEFYRNTMQGDAINETERMRSIAFEKASEGGFKINPTYWFQKQTEKINLMKQVENQLSEDFLKLSQRLESEAAGEMMFFSVLAIVSLTVSVLLFFVVSRSITNTLAQTVEIAESVANGDLTREIDTSRKDELGILMQTMKNLVSKLSMVVGEVQANVDQVSTASSQVSDSAQALSQGASEQAASLEETSSTLEEIMAMINQNAENARETNQVAGKVSEQADEGGKAVNDTVSAMNNIAERISVIEDIAYKTNLLALNAAIEAARAGKYGSGFAVVADEVRKLAERSQVSAQEISELAANSVKVAERAGKLINEIVPAITKTAGLVSEIAASSDEQATGVNQVNTAMSQLDQVAQGSVASSEELAATAEELSGQADNLQQAIQFFKIK